MSLKCLIGGAGLAALVVGLAPARAADFARDIQPVFAAHCYECHGPKEQYADLRLDDRAAALSAGVITPGNAEKSELYRRITLPRSHDDVMPNRGEPLGKAASDRIRDWINEGAEWPENFVAATHWSYVKPVRPAPPETKTKGWVRNPIDRFVLARLEMEGLRPSEEAGRERLLRRVHLDLIGLPPSPDEVAAFLADDSPDAYEKVVERLLASPQYGVRWARPWLDLARYADSSGFQKDDLWGIWPYRDWVVRALNADMPFDQFTVEQLAGDLLPDATADQKVATGFNRCTPTNVEAGSDQEETRVTQVLDRVNTVGAAWLGSTLECAQCHDHKYDPFSQKEYFQLYAFFNNTARETEFTGTAMIGLKFTGPYMDLPDKETAEKRKAIEARIAAVDGKIHAARTRLLAERDAWEADLAARLATLTQAHRLEVEEFTAESGSPHRVLDDGSILLLADENAAAPQTDTYKLTVRTGVTGITGFKLDVLTDPSLPGTGPGRGDERRPNFVLNELSVTAAGDPARPIKLRNARASFGQKNFGVRAAIDSDPTTGWGINPQFFRNHWAVFETPAPLGGSGGGRFTFTLDQDNGGGRTIGRFRISALTGAPGADAYPAGIVEVLRTPADARTAEQDAQLTEYYLGAHPVLADLNAARAKLSDELRGVKPPQSLVMKELETPRPSAVFTRGSFLDPGEAVQPGVPAVLHPLPAGERNRLTLARWLVSPENPLVARVTVNRWWAEFFGHGLVTTPEDFGIRGESPTHPELLDWLATEFVAPQGGKAWSAKHIHRLIATSATYRQASGISPKLLERDDQNKLYARGPRFRMDAEMIRDNALAAAGLLSRKLEGPPVRPYQPPGLWESKVGGVRVTYEVSPGEDRHRRGLYTVWKRTSPYPSFINFDAPGRNACTVKRARSNTPLQALTLLNDPVYVEAAGALAKRVQEEKPSASPEDRVRHAFLLCTGRAPTPRELDILSGLYRDQLKSSQKQGPDAEADAWFAVSSALLNLDETITKG
jgi:hypothetical protein